MCGRDRRALARLAAHGVVWPEHARLSAHLQMFHAQFLASVPHEARLLRAVADYLTSRGVIPQPVPL